MKKLKNIGMVIGAIIATIITCIIIGVLIIVSFLLPPRMKSNEKKSVRAYVEGYLTEKYGNHNFKVTKIDYDYHMQTLFDYSHRTGYDVHFKSNIVKDSYVNISGVYPNDYKVSSDSFINDYYFGKIDLYERYKLLESIKPVEKIQTHLLNKLKQDFEPSCQIVKYCNVKQNIPNNLGRIPTIEELKNNISYYEILNFDYTLTDKIENEEEYKNKLSEFLKQNLGGEWNIYLYPKTGSVSCLKK